MTGRLTRWLGVALLAAALVPAVADAARSGKAPKPGAPLGPVENTGRWFTDAKGRVVVFHGINMVAKRPPYRPSSLGFGPDDARFLARNGFNNVRLGLIYAGVEPQPGVYDDAYIADSLKTTRRLERRGIFTMVDFHQDLYNERFDGEGWPAWATLDDGLPADPKPGFPITYLTSPGMNRAFDNFWDNARGPGGVGLQDRYAAAWAHVAKAFNDEELLMGYDLMNEPWPGSIFATCLSTAGCPDFDRNKLAPMWARMIEAIRDTGSKSIIFSEPNVLFNFGVNTSLPDLGENQGFSFHDYCLTGLVAGAPSTCDQLDALVFDNAEAHSERTGDSLILSEFGATQDIPTLNRVVDLADDHMVSWQEWHYCGCDDPTTSGPGDEQALVKDPALPPVGDNVFRTKLAALARPYPQVVAGTPRSWSFDPDTKRFELVYVPRRADGKGSFRRGRSLVFVPKIHYPSGYSVRAKGAKVESKPGSKRLLLRARGNASSVTVTITPR